MLLSAEALTKSFGPLDVITNAKLVIEPGDRIGLVGDNGAGKTTLIRILMGQMGCDSGELNLRTEKIGYLPQFPDFSLEAKVKDVIGAPYGQISKISKRLLELEQIMADPSDTNVDWTAVGEEYSKLQEEFSHAGGHYFSSRTGEVLEEVGLGFGDVLKVTVYLTDVSDRVKINPIREAYFGDSLPASTLVGVKELPFPQMKVEIEAIAGFPE